MSQNQKNVEGKALAPVDLEDKAVAAPEPAAAPEPEAQAGEKVTLAHPYEQHPVGATITVDAQTARLLRNAGYAQS